MPKRTDIKKICIIGAGPIIIGQACEFDYSGSQACKALREDGYEVVLLNSNPATIMTDPDMADRTYIEPVTPNILAAILEKERPQALLPNLGGQTALNTAFKVAEMGVLERLGVELIGVTKESIHRAENREAFRSTMQSIGIDLPRSGLAHNMQEAMKIIQEIGLPCIIRPAFTLGGTGGGMAYNMEEFERMAQTGIYASMVSEILIEESVEGWKELEVEVMRDRNDHVMILCTIENFDPMGVHTGDSITFAPILTLSAKEQESLREQSFRIIRAINIESGGCNIQYAQCPKTGRFVAIEINPRVSRSSALASKATGFPIAKITAKVAVGYSLDELKNDLIPIIPSSSEPTIDYVVVKIPRFAFEKFPGANETLTISMKSVGEVMAIGRTFKEAMHKGLRAMENGQAGLGADGKDIDLKTITEQQLINKLAIPNRERLRWIRYAILKGMTNEQINEISHIDPWFIQQLREIVEEESVFQKENIQSYSDDEIRHAKELGFSDIQLAYMTKSSEKQVREERWKRNIHPVCKMVDTCGGEFEPKKPYYYLSYEQEDETRLTTKPTVMILGGGPNRIGQGIEFDYCCCHASFAAQKLGYETIIVNCNPETVSTDFDTSDRLYFEPLTVEDALEIVRVQKPLGLIVQFGGQTPLNIARKLTEAGVKLFGTSVDSIDRASDRGAFAEMLKKLNLKQTQNATATELEDSLQKAEKIGYPVLMRPSFVLGGAKMEIIYTSDGLKQYWAELITYCQKADVTISPERPILLDKFLQDATEVDVDALCDGKQVYIAGVMEHIEEAGIHSGDSACSLPPYSLTENMIKKMEDATRKLALELNVSGLMNVQYAVKDDEVYVLEVNPRASRTVPFVSKVTGIQIAKIATEIMLGKSLADCNLGERAPKIPYFAVKESVFPFNRFPGVDAALGPEMKSTGEVMGIAPSFPLAFANSQIGANQKMPIRGTAFISVNASLRKDLPKVAKKLVQAGFNLIATDGTARAIRALDIPVERIKKVSEGRPNVIDLMIDERVHLVINTPSGKAPNRDEISIRTTAVARGIQLETTMEAAIKYVDAIVELQKNPNRVMPLQDYHALIR